MLAAGTALPLLMMGLETNGANKRVKHSILVLLLFSSQTDGLEWPPIFSSVGRETTSIEFLTCVWLKTYLRNRRNYLLISCLLVFLSLSSSR